jgi:hypothetical protein
VIRVLAIDARHQLLKSYYPWMNNQTSACSFGWWLMAGAGLF